MKSDLNKTINLNKFINMIKYFKESNGPTKTLIQ